jgi:hypothetical protein
MHKVRDKKYIERSFMTCVGEKSHISIKIIEVISKQKNR